jgi:hypothetical protein
MTSTLRHNDKSHPSSSPSTINTFCLDCDGAHNLPDLFDTTAAYATGSTWKIDFALSQIISVTPERISLHRSPNFIYT